MVDIAPLSAGQIKYFASQAGFAGNDLNIAVAVALAESGGNPQSHNSTPPDDSYGLWQINMLGSMGPDRRKQFGIATNTALFDPSVNAKAAHMIFGGSGWRAWSTYASGAYKKFLAGATAAPAANNAGRTPTQEQTVLDNTRNDATPDSLLPNSIVSAVNGLSKTLFSGVSNVAGIIVAIVLVLGGIAILITQTKVGKTAVKTAAGAAKVAMIA